MTHDPHDADVTITHFAETPVAALEHRGHPAHLGESIRRFIAWRKQNGLPPSRSATFNVFRGGPDAAPNSESHLDRCAEASELHLDLCAAAPHPIAENPFGVIAKTIPAGLCAVLRHVGSDDTLEQSIRYLYATWLPASGEELRDFPLFVQRVRFFPDVPENEAVKDIHLPLQ